MFLECSGFVDFLIEILCLDFRVDCFETLCDPLSSDLDGFLEEFLLEYLSGFKYLSYFEFFK